MALQLNYMEATTNVKYYNDSYIRLATYMYIKHPRMLTWTTASWLFTNVHNKISYIHTYVCTHIHHAYTHTLAKHKYLHFYHLHMEDVPHVF